MLKFLKKIGAQLPPSRPKRRFRGETTMKRIPYYRQLDLPIGGAPTSFHTGALPSPAAGGASGTGAFMAPSPA